MPALLAIFLVAAGLIYFPGLLPRPADGQRDSLNQDELRQLIPGDLILRKGVGTPSDLIVSVLNDGTGLSHCAMVLETRGTHIVLVHCINRSLGSRDGVQTQELADFNRNSHVQSIVVVRPDVDKSLRDRIVSQARAFLARSIPFDNGYNLADRSAFYCSELLVATFETAGWWQQAQRGSSPNYQFSGPVLNFRTFLNPKFFTVLLSHNPAVPYSPPSTKQTAP